jgi:hypothetical protein
MADIPPAARRSWIPPVLAIASLSAAWVAVFAGRDRIGRLDLSMFGPCQDVPEALARDAYIGSQIQPYFAAAIAFDVTAVLASIWSML